MLILDGFYKDVELSVEEQQSRALKLQKKTNCSGLQNIIKCVMNTKSSRHVYPFGVFLYPFQFLFLLLNSSLHTLFPS